MIKILAERNITSFTLDGIPRISRAQQMDALTSMSTVAGYKAVITASNHLPRFIPMMPTAAGVIPPAQFLVLGTGVAGLQSVATAKRLGAKVKALDIRPEANEQARSLGAEVIPFELPGGLGLGQGGYACRLTDEWYQKEREVLAPHVAAADVIILTALVMGEKAPILIDEAMVGTMKNGAVIVDISIDQGGNCELTRAGEEYYHRGVLISGLANIPATLATDSTKMFAQNVLYYLNHLVRDGKVDRDAEDQIIRESMVTRDRKIVHQGTLLAMC
jgi:H+-translocating NAD(P) transhydrogenase subunit alpha